MKKNEKIIQRRKIKLNLQAQKLKRTFKRMKMYDNPSIYEENTRCDFTDNLNFIGTRSNGIKQI